MAEVLMFPNVRAEQMASPVVLQGPGWRLEVPYVELRVFLEHLKQVRMGRRVDAVFSRLTVQEMDGVIEGIELRLELGVN